MGYQDNRGRGRRDKGRQRCRLTRGANERAVVAVVIEKGWRRYRRFGGDCGDKVRLVLKPVSQG